MEHESEARAIIEAVERLHSIEAISFTGEEKDTDLLVVPKPGGGLEVVDLKPYRDKRRDSPERMKGTARATTLQSFIDLVNRSADVHSALFVDDNAAAPRLLAVLDYNEPRLDGEAHGAGARFGEHRVEYAFPLSDEWKRWTQAHDQAMHQQGFAEFLEDRITDVIDPATAGEKLRSQMAQLGFSLADPTQLLALSKGLSINVGAKVHQATNLSTGEVQVAFEESHSTKDAAGREVRVPGGFALGIPVFRGGAHYEVPVRLRYRAREGAITWRVLLSRTETILQHAITEAAAKAADGTSLPTYYGTPES